jgi:dihydrofolate reductase
MRNLIFAINLSLDGCCDHTKMNGDEEIHDYFTQLMQEIDLMVYGRITYELMVPFWPDVAKSKSGPTKAYNDFAQKFDSLDKIVISKTLSSVEDSNSRIIRTNIKDEILKLKQQPGKAMMTGGVSIPTHLIELGLVNEFVFLIRPVVVGEGRRLLDHASLQENLQLKLVESRIFKSGGIALRYSK